MYHLKWCPIPVSQFLSCCQFSVLSVVSSTGLYKLVCWTVKVYSSGCHLSIFYFSPRANTGSCTISMTSGQLWEKLSIWCCLSSIMDSNGAIQWTMRMVPLFFIGAPLSTAGSVYNLTEDCECPLEIAGRECNCFRKLPLIYPWYDYYGQSQR